MIKRSSKILTITISIAIVLLCWVVDLSAQEKKDYKKWEITSYLGTGGRGSENQLGNPFDVLGIGLGLEYFYNPRISVEGEFNYLPNIAYAVSSAGWRPSWWDEYNVTFIGEHEKYRLLWDINYLFYFDITRIKKPAMRWFLTLGTGFQYDRKESTYILLETLEQYKHRYGSFWFQWITFGGGLKVNIKNNWALRLLYRIHHFFYFGEEVLTSRLALGLSYRF